MEGVEVSGPFFDSFKVRSVFIIGHTGFKGSWLSLWLHKLGAQVTGYSLSPPTEPNNFVASGVKDVLKSHYEADVRNASELHRALKSNEPDVVFHLAAQSLVRESYLSPRETFDVNVMGTACLLDGVRMLKRPCVVIVVTSDKCYKNHEQARGYHEADPLGGHDPYSASKGAAEILTAAYRRSFFDPQSILEHGVKLATVRAGNVFGGGDWAKDRIVTDIVKALSTNAPIRLRHPNSVRPWQHVLEPLSGYLTLASKMLQFDDPQWCSAWNFGPLEEEMFSVKQLAEKFCQAWGSGSWVDCSDTNAFHETGILRLSIDKVTKELGWRARWQLEQAVDRTARWYRSFYSGPASMRKACEADITAYEETTIH